MFTEANMQELSAEFRRLKLAEIEAPKPVVRQPSQFNTWIVSLRGEVIDKMWFLKGCDEWEVLEQLINHDGFDPNIEVKPA
jgi:hypothetical protein